MEPVKERQADELWLVKIIKRGPEQDDEGDEQEQQNPRGSLSLRTGYHDSSPFELISAVCIIRLNFTVSREEQTIGTLMVATVQVPVL